MCCQEENTHWNGSSEVRFYFRKALIGVSIEKIFGMLHHLYQTSWARLWKTYFLFIHVGNLLSCIGRVVLWGKSKVVGSSNCIETSLYIFEGYTLVCFNWKRLHARWATCHKWDHHEMTNWTPWEEIEMNLICDDPSIIFCWIGS